MEMKWVNIVTLPDFPSVIRWVRVVTKKMYVYGKKKKKKESNLGDDGFTWHMLVWLQFKADFNIHGVSWGCDWWHPVRGHIPLHLNVTYDSTENLASAFDTAHTAGSATWCAVSTGFHHKQRDEKVTVFKNKMVLSRWAHVTTGQLVFSRVAQ